MCLRRQATRLGYPWRATVAAIPGVTESAVETSDGSLRALVGKPLEEVEKRFIVETLQQAGGNRESAAEMLGIGERTLYRKIKEYGL